MTHNKTEDMIPIFHGINGTTGDLMNLSFFYSPFISLKGLWNDVFIAIIISGTIMMTFSGIVLPSLGGDQVNYHDKALILAHVMALLLCNGWEDMKHNIGKYA